MAPCSGRDSREKCRSPWPRQSKSLIAMRWVIRHSPYWPRLTDRVGEVIVRITEEKEERKGRITGMGQTRLLPSTKIRWMPAAASDRSTMAPRGARTQKERGRGTAREGRGTAKKDHGMARGSHGTATGGSGVTPMRRCRMHPAATTPSTPVNRLSTRTGTAAGTGARGRTQVRRLGPHLSRV